MCQHTRKSQNANVIGAKLGATRIQKESWPRKMRRRSIVSSDVVVTAKARNKTEKSQKQNRKVREQAKRDPTVISGNERNQARS